MADKCYTFELTDGTTRKLVSVTTPNEAAFERYARAAGRSADAEGTGFKIDPDSAIDHGTAEQRQAYVAEYRKKQGKPAEPSAAELAANAVKVFGKIRSNDPKALAAAKPPPAKATGP